MPVAERRPREDEVGRFRGALQESLYVGREERSAGEGVPLGKELPQGGDGAQVFFYEGDMGGAPREELEAYAARAGKEVNGFFALEAPTVGKDVEEGFSGFFGEGAGRRARGKGNGAPLPLTLQYPHRRRLAVRHLLRIGQLP